MTMIVPLNCFVPVVLMKNMRQLVLGLFFAGLLAGCSQPSTPASTDPVLPVKVVLVTMFEIGADEGDTAGEFQLWKARRNLTQRVP